jgi:hypothetical protein
MTKFMWFCLVAGFRPDEKVTGSTLDPENLQKKRTDPTWCNFQKIRSLLVGRFFVVRRCGLNLNINRFNLSTQRSLTP